MPNLTRKQKTEQTIIKKYGSLEAYKEAQRASGAKGGRKSNASHLKDPAKAREVGLLGAKARWSKEDKHE